MRVVAATNRPLEQEVAQGRFRDDLFYRLDVVRLQVPPLREREKDVLLLADHFWSQAQLQTESRAALGRATCMALANYHWPGNVRQLENVIAGLAVRGPRRGTIGADALPPGIVSRSPEKQTLQEARQRFERGYVRGVLAQAGGRRGKAALALGVTRQGLAKLLKRVDLDAAAGGPSEPAVDVTQIIS